MPLRISLLLILTLFLSNTHAQKELSIFRGFVFEKYYEGSERIPMNEFETKIRLNQESKKLWNKHKRHKIYGLVSLASGLSLNSSIGDELFGKENRRAMNIASVFCYASYIGFTISSFKQRRRSILKYNEDLLSNSQIFINEKGVGILVSF